MSILPFGNFAQKRRTMVTDWTNQEMADFFRAHRLLVQTGATIGIDKGRSDIGEPWLVFYDTASQDVFLHIARIDQRCVLVCDHLNINITADRIEQLISRFEIEIRSTLSLRADRSSNVVAHPAAKIIMSISAVFLLFKLDNNSSAFAREASAALPQDGNWRKEAGLPSRVQSALARLFDGAETPVAMAALASVILASDLLTAESHDANDGLTPTSEVLHVAPLEQHVFQLDVNQELADASLEAAASLAVQHNVPLIEVSSEKQVIDGEGNSLDGPELILVHDLFQAAAIFDGAAAFIQNHSSSSSAPVVEVAENQPNVIETPVTTLSAQMLSGVAAFNLSEVSQADLANGIVILDDGSFSLTGAIAFDLSPEAETSYGFSTDTALDGEQLMAVLRYLIVGMGRFELESVGNSLVVAQLDVAGDDAALLGIWSNTMSDGSTISIVGSIALLDDIPALLGGSHIIA